MKKSRPAFIVKSMYISCMYIIYDLDVCARMRVHICVLVCNTGEQTCVVEKVHAYVIHVYCSIFDSCVLHHMLFMCIASYSKKISYMYNISFVFVCVRVCVHSLRVCACACTQSSCVCVCVYTFL